MDETKELLRFSALSALFLLLAIGLPVLVAFGPFYLGVARVNFASPEATTVLLGDSTCEYDLDDSMIPGAVNFGHSASSIPHSFWRLVRYLNQNPQTKRVVFAWQPNVFTGKHVDSYGAYASLKHLPFMSKEDFGAMGYTRDDFRKFFLAAYKGRAKGADPFLPAYCLPTREYWGRYRKTDVAKLKKQLEREGMPTRRRVDSGEKPPAYWLKLLELIRSRGLELVIFRPPLFRYDDYFDRAAEDARLKRLLPPGTRILDFTDFPLAEGEFRDRMHLNMFGARRLSPVFAEELDGR